MDSPYVSKEAYVKEQKKESYESTFSSSRKYTFKGQKSALEEQLLELNTRNLSLLVKKIVKFDGEIWKRLENDCRGYGDALEKLKNEYKEDFERAEKLDGVVITLQSNNKKLKERAEEFQAKYENLMTKYENQQKVNNDLELQFRNTRLALDRKTQELLEKENLCKDLSEKNYEQEITIKKLEKRSEDCERKLEHFKNVRTQPESAKDFIEESLYEIPNCFSKMHSAFWKYIEAYFDKLEMEFKTEIKTTRNTELEKFTKHVKKQKEESLKMITSLRSEREEEMKLIARLEDENISLQQQLGNAKLQKEAYETTSQFTSSFTTSVDINLTFGYEEDKGLQDQAGFYEALLNLGEEEENEIRRKDMKKNWEELRKCYFTDPPEHIRKRLESTRQLLDDPSDTSVGSWTNLTRRHDDNKESTQDRTDQVAETMENDEVD